MSRYSHESPRNSRYMSDRHSPIDRSPTRSHGTHGTARHKPERYDRHDRHERREKHSEKTRSSRISSLTAHLVAASGEFVGTVLFLWFAFAWHGTVSGNAIEGTNPSELVMFISIGYGFSLLVNAWVFYRISGGLFNPAVCLGMVLSGSLPLTRALFLIPVEIIGGIVAAALVECMFPGPISVTNTTLGEGVSQARGVFIEMFLTSLLLLTIYMLAAEKSKVTFIAPLGIGLALFIAELAGVYYTGGSLNPARSFGPAVVSGQFPSYHWIYWVGPALGSGLSAVYYRFAKAMNYEQANPGQDSAAGEFRQDV